MRGARPSLALFLLVPLLGGCLTSRAGLSTPAPLPVSPKVQALRGSIAPVASIKLSSRAEQAALDAEYQALQFGAVGQPVDWQSDGVTGQFIPTQLYRVGSQDCRGFTHVISKGGTRVKQVGSACRSGDDLWTPVA
ncbi:hypothetical protein [Aureimonas pseudogalii]|uniref:Surface antigen n=1 Tax=Aureimonas pseudogalii TaxID=1744844 RepID=A0A7W6H366_9HYPH|nr:hypothetical protein [Aureimonas pseudogalii]MBB3996558.1 surface antigen [Aureimonas pseudogalii]